jgi:peptide/nickel transport system ATP-binding protein
MPLLTIENLSVDFVTQRETTAAVKNISLTVNHSEIVALVGESGSGKSVTALSILRLLPSPPARYTSGRILFHTGDDTVDLATLSPKALQQLRGNKIAMIFQEPMTSLNPVMACGPQVAEALLHHKILKPKEARRQTIEWFGKVQLPQPETLFHRYPHQLSGGQKQRVMIAMAMCCNPSLLICDEPTTALDVTVQNEILQLIKDLQHQSGMGVIFITHDLGVVAQIADRVAIMYRGAVVEENKTSTVFQNPMHDYTKALIACRPALHPKGEPLPQVADFIETNLSERGTTAVKRPASTFSKPHVAEMLVQVQNIVIKYPAKTNLIGTPISYTTAVNGVSFDICRGETVGLVGESGCGKTTIGRTLLHLIKPTRGRMLFNGVDSTALDKKGMKNFRKEVQLVFQDPYSSLNPRLTIQDALTEPMQSATLYKTARERRSQAMHLLDRVGLASGLRNRYPHQFSGGQRQRIVIARALAVQPQFLVCDESVSALDVSVQAQVLNLLNELKQDFNLTLLFISHDLSVVRYMSDRILVMKAGEIVESGDAEKIYYQPQHPYTQQLLAAVAKLER